MTDPKRLLEDPRSDDLAELLSAGKSEMPNAAQLGSLAAKLGVLGGGIGVAAAVGGAGASAKAAGTAGAGAAGASSAGAGAVGVTAAKAGIGLKLAGAVVLAGAVGTSAVVVKSAREEAPQTPTGIVATFTATTRASASAPEPRLGTDEPSNEPSARPSTAPAASQRRAPAPSTAGPEAEVRLLERAQDALRSRPAEALALADEHARQFPQGMLVQEREVIAIEALMKTGRASEAKARAARFKTRFPGSSHSRRVDALVAE